MLDAGVKPALGKTIKEKNNNVWKKKHVIDVVVFRQSQMLSLKTEGVIPPESKLPRKKT